MTHDILVSFSFLLSDTDNDEIEIVNQNDYEIFLAKCEHNMHVQIAPLAPVQEEVQAKASKQENAAPSADDPSNFIIHDNVECDGCGVGPIVGFRYKCVQCSNFDLCQRCEAAHKHPEHLMVRMPTNDGPNVVEAWLTGPTPWGDVAVDAGPGVTAPSIPPRPLAAQLRLEILLERVVANAVTPVVTAASCPSLLR